MLAAAGARAAADGRRGRGRRELVELKGGGQMFDPIDRRHRSSRPRARCCRPIRSSRKDLNEVARAAAHANSRRAATSWSTEAAKFYAQRFTEAELKELVAFYKTPLGKKMVAQEPQALDETFKYVAAVGAARRRGGDEPLPRRDEEEGAQSLDSAPDLPLDERLRHRPFRHRRRLRRRARRAHRGRATARA